MKVDRALFMCGVLFLSLSACDGGGSTAGSTADALPDAVVDGAAGDADLSGTPDAEDGPDSPQPGEDTIPPWTESDVATGGDILAPSPPDLCADFQCPETCVLYATNTGAGAMDGTSPTDAFGNLQAAVDAAAVAAGPCCTCEVRVGAGMYFLYESSPRDTLLLRARVHLRGGFPYDHNGAQDPTLWQTMLSGGEVGGDPLLRVRHVITAEDGAVLEGVLVQHGYGAADSFPPDFWDPEDHGGGMLVHGADDVVIRDTTFTDNENSLGGGLAVLNGSATLEGCRFQTNRAWMGAGLYAFHSTLEIVDTVFAANDATASGGALVAWGASEISLIGTAPDACLLSGNEALIDGGALGVFFSILDVSGCVFTENTAREFGGAGAFSDAEVTITDSIFTSNGITTDCDNEWGCDDQGGGALSVDEGQLTLDGVTLAGNKGANCGGNMGTPPLSPAQCSGTGGAIFAEDGAFVHLVDTTVTGNIAGLGGALAGQYDAVFDLMGCTLEDNQATRFTPYNWGGRGGAIHLYDATAQLYTSLCRSNHSEGAGGCIFAEESPLTIIRSELRENAASTGGGFSAFAWDQTSPVFVESSLFQGNTAWNSGGAGDVGPGAEPADFINCTFHGNTADIDGGALVLGGGALAGATLTGSIVWGNSNPALMFFSGAPPGVVSSDVQVLNPEEGGLSADPKFVDPPTNLRLQADSPCIHQGLTSAVSETLDLDGNPRIVGADVDMGAYENQEVQ